MYAPSKHEGSDPCTTSHSVGGSSSTGAKLSESTCLGSTKYFRGGSMKLLMISSHAFNTIFGIVGSARFLGKYDD